MPEIVKWRSQEPGLIDTDLGRKIPAEITMARAAAESHCAPSACRAWHPTFSIPGLVYLSPDFKALTWQVRRLRLRESSYDPVWAEASMWSGEKQEPV